VLFGSYNAHRSLRQQLVEEHFLEGVVSLPSGVFRPYAGVSTAILLFTKTGRGGTDSVWFYDMTADCWSLDDKRNPLLPLEKLGPAPNVALAEREHDKNNLPDCLTRWRQRKGSERERERTAQSFCVPKAEIAAEGYDLSLNRHKELIHDEVEHRPPLDSHGPRPPLPVAWASQPLDFCLGGQHAIEGIAVSLGYGASPPLESCSGRNHHQSSRWLSSR